MRWSVVVLVLLLCLALVSSALGSGRRHRRHRRHHHKEEFAQLLSLVKTSGVLNELKIPFDAAADVDDANDVLKQNADLPLKLLSSLAELAAVDTPAGRASFYEAAKTLSSVMDASFDLAKPDAKYEVSEARADNDKPDFWHRSFGKDVVVLAEKMEMGLRSDRLCLKLTDKAVQNTQGGAFTAFMTSLTAEYIPPGIPAAADRKPGRSLAATLFNPKFFSGEVETKGGKAPLVLLQMDPAPANGWGWRRFGLRACWGTAYVLTKLANTINVGVAMVTGEDVSPMDYLGAMVEVSELFGLDNHPLAAFANDMQEQIQGNIDYYGLDELLAADDM